MNTIQRYTPYGLPFLEITGCEEFNTAHIFECGQCFRWELLPGSAGIYFGVAGGRAAAVSVRQGETGNIITIANAKLADFEGFWRNYFDLDRDYSEIRMLLSDKDPYLKEAASFGGGIRILRQEPFETLISFILSANNNIPRIKGCVAKLSAAYGERINVSDAFYQYLSENSTIENEPFAFYSFPTPEKLSTASAEDISACCKAGYRCAYIQKTVRSYTENPLDCAAVRASERTQARNILQAYTGVGPKVADCILLFAGMRTDVFPIDVWVRRVIERLYLHHEVTLPEAEAFAAAYFGDLAGYAQQYLFYNIREQERSSAKLNIH